MVDIGIFLLFILHHVLNLQWSRNLLKGKYTLFRAGQTLLAALLLAAMAGAMLSGILISRHAFAFLPINGGKSFGRILHMLSVYWCFVLMSVHLGFHWNMIMGMAGKVIKKSFAVRSWTLRIPALAVAVYGIAALKKRQLDSYLFLESHFAFFDYEEPLLFFLLDYLCIMGLFVWTGHYLATALRGNKTKAEPAV